MGGHNPVNSAVSMCCPLLSPQGYLKTPVHSTVAARGPCGECYASEKADEKGLCLGQRREWAELEARTLAAHLTDFVLILRTKDVL